MSRQRRGLARIRNERGFTLVELLVASLVFVATVGVLLSLMGRNESAFEASRNILESRQSARSTLDFVTSEIRMAGSGISVPVVTSTASSDSLLLYPITPATVGGNSERITILGKFGGVETTVREKMPNASAAIKVHSVEGFSEGDLLVITNESFANLFQVTKVLEGSRMLQHNPSSPYNKPGGHRPWPPTGYDVGSRVFKADLITYYVDRADTTCPVVMRQEGGEDARPISDHVSLLDFQYELSDQTIVSMPDDPLLIRKVIVTVEAACNERLRRHMTRLVSAAKPRSI